MQYLDKKCPNCKFLLERTNNTSWSFGNPLVVCPNCGTILIDEKRKEVLMLSSLDYFTYFLWSFVGVVSISAILSLIIYGLLNQLLDVDITTSIIISCIFLGIFIIMVAILTVKQYKKEKSKSLERLKDENYYNKLKELGLLEVRKENFSNYQKKKKNENLIFIILIMIFILIAISITLLVKRF